MAPCIYLSKLLDDAKTPVGLIGVEHLDDVLVFQALQNFYFLPQVLYVLLRLSALVDKLGSADLTGVPPSGHVDLYKIRIPVYAYLRIYIIHICVFIHI